MSLPTCRICGHVHDPEDGRCDAHARVGLGRCPCPGEAIFGVAGALVDAFARGQKLSYTGHLVVTDPDSPATVSMVLDEADYAVLCTAAVAGIPLNSLSERSTDRCSYAVTANGCPAFCRCARCPEAKNAPPRGAPA